MADGTDLPQTTAETLSLAGRYGPPPTLATGTAQGATGEDGYTSVKVRTDADTFDEEAEDEGEDANPAIPVQTLVRGVASQEEVWVLTDPSGASLAVPFAAPTFPVFVGLAPASDIPIASTSAVPITDLEVTVEVDAPGHVLSIDVNVHLSSGAASNTLIGRVMRRDEDGNVQEVGRFLRSNQLGNNESIQAGVPVKDYNPEPGVWVYYPSVQASVTGWTLVLNASSSPLTMATICVTDEGAASTSSALM